MENADEAGKKSKKYDNWIWTMRWIDNAASLYMVVALVALFIKTYGIFENF